MRRPVISGRPGTLQLIVVSGLAALLLAIDAGAVREAAALAGVEVGSGDALLLYVRVPLATLAACALVLAPGLLVARAWGLSEALPLPDGWILYGFGLGIALCCLLVAALAASDVRAVGPAFVGLLFGAALVAGGVAWAREGRARTGPDASDPSPGETDAESYEAGGGRPPGPPGAAVWATYAVPPFLLVAGLAPKFLWESFNGDGAHAFEAARLLLVEPVPFWGGAAGGISNFPGLSSMLFAYPASVFIRIFGEVEAAARLPFVLYLIGLYAAIAALARADRPWEDGRAARKEAARERRLLLPDRGLVWLALLAYTLVVAYSATYNPYHADLALPATQDTLFIAAFLGFAFAFVRDDVGGIALFLPLVALGLPSWPLLVGGWLVAVILLWRPIPRRALGASLAGAALLVVGLAIAPVALGALGLPGPGGEYGGDALLGRLSYLRLTEWRRWLYLAVPAGVLPVLYLVLWNRQDAVARALTVVAALYFGFFYVQAFTALHHYLPAAVLAVPVFWRDRDEGRARDVRRAVAAVAGLVALALAYPADPAPHLAAREVGRRIEDRRAGYATFDPRIFRPAPTLYGALFARPARARAEGTYGVSPLVLTYYAHHGERAGPVPYVIDGVGGPDPPGVAPLAVEEGAALYVLDEAAWRVDRARDPATSVAPALTVPPHVLYRGGGTRGAIDVRRLLRRLGLP